MIQAVEAGWRVCHPSNEMLIHDSVSVLFRQDDDQFKASYDKQVVLLYPRIPKININEIYENIYTVQRNIVSICGSVIELH